MAGWTVWPPRSSCIFWGLVSFCWRFVAKVQGGTDNLLLQIFFAVHLEGCCCLGIVLQDETASKFLLEITRVLVC